MDENDAKNRFYDVLPPDSAKKTTELNMQNRKMMVNDPIEPSVPDKPIINMQDSPPLEVERETVIDPMLTQPNQANEIQPKPDAQNATDQVEPENNYKVPAANEEFAEDNIEPTEATEPETPENSPTADQADEPQSPTVDTEPAVAPEQAKPAEEPTLAISEEPQTSAEQSSQPETVPEPETSPAKESTSSGSFTSVDGLPDASTQEANPIKDEMQEPKIYDTSVYHVPIKETVHSHGAVKSALIFGAIFAVIIVSALVFILFKYSSN